MKFRPNISGIVLTLLTLAIFQCSAANQLRHHEFNGKTVSDRLNAPYIGTIITNPVLRMSINNATGSHAGIEPTQINRDEAENARIILDRAAGMINIPGEVADCIVNGCSTCLELYRITEKTRADFIFDILVNEYGIDSSSWTSTAYFVLKVNVSLTDQNGAAVWKTTDYFREPFIPGSHELGSPLPSGSVTAISLAQYRAEDIASALGYYANLAAAKIIAKLQRDHAGLDD